MCSIFGLGFQKGHKITDVKEIKEVVASLLVSGQSRGSDAAGLAVASSKKIVVLKDPITGTELSKSGGFDQLFQNDVNFKGITHDSLPTMSILGHCRAQTQGTYRNNDNNHPIIAEKVIGVHNGCISNDNSLFQIFPEMKRKAQVDSEVIFRFINYCLDHGKSMQEAIRITGKQITGWFACAAINASNPFALWLFRDRTPLDVLYYQSVGLVIFATSKHMIETAVKGHSFGIASEMEVGYESGMGIDLWTGDFTKFKFDTELINAL